MSNHAQQKTSLISLGIPDIQCLWDRKTTVFGKHILDYTGSSVPENKGAPFEATMCNGMLNLVDTPATPKVRCENCSLTIPINGKSQSHSEWENIIYEWMRIVFSFSLIFSMRTRLGLKLNSLESVCWHESGVRSLKSFTPELDEVDPEAVSLCLVGLPRKSYPFLPLLSQKRVAVIEVAGLGYPEESLRLFGMTAMLMRQLEYSFQERIRKAAVVAASASEFMHPTTRR